MNDINKNGNLPIIEKYYKEVNKMKLFMIIRDKESGFYSIN
jgi:hypothetical protein